MGRVNIIILLKINSISKCQWTLNKSL